MRRLLSALLLLAGLLVPARAQVWPFPEGAGLGNQGIPAVDGTAPGGGNVSTFTITLTTTQANDWVLIAAAQSANGSSFITGVSSTHLSGCQQRATGFRNDGGGTITGSLWYCKASGVLSGEVITVNMGAGGGIVEAVAIGISGINQTVTCPFDSNAGLTNVNTGAPGTAANTVISTSNYHNLNLFFNFVSGSLNQVLANYNEIIYNNGFVVQIAAFGQQTTVRQFGATLIMGGTNASDWVAMSDSVTSDVNSGTCPF